MKRLSNDDRSLRIVGRAGTGKSMNDIVSFLRTTADELDDTARRCTDPVIVSELREIGATMREKAVMLELP